jgi:hypothetical protein
VAGVWKVEPTFRETPTKKTASATLQLRPTVAMWLDGLALEGGFLGIGEGVFCFGRGLGGGGEGLCTGVDLGGFFAGCLEFLGFSA